MNVFIVMFDSLRHDYRAFNGHPYVKTPNIDALAAFFGCLHYHEAVRTPEWKFIDNRGERENELYNIAEDPTESRNILDAEPELARKLHRMLWEFHLPWCGEGCWRDRPQRGLAG